MYLAMYMQRERALENEHESEFLQLKAAKVSIIIQIDYVFIMFLRNLKLVFNI